MRGENMKKGFNLFLLFTVLFCFLAPYFPVKADTLYDVYLETSAGSNFINSFGSYQEAHSFALAKENENQDYNLIIYKDSKIRYTTYGLINFNTKGNATTSYTIEFNGRNGYTNGAYGADAAFLGTNEDGSLVRFKQAGVTGWVNSSEVEIVNMNASNYKRLYTNAYVMTYTDQWELRHNITTDITKQNAGSKLILGTERPYGMANNTYYLSYDGHYFYKENLEGYRAMIRDYKAGVYTNSINPYNPYYNYYQFLSHRSISNYTSAQIKQNLSGYASKPTAHPALANESQLFGEEISFIQYQNEFGANAIMMLGTAKNESANGKSQISISKNNLFGHSAFDSSPGASATGYVSVAQSIYAHAKFYISEGYLDPCDGYQVYENGTNSKCHNGKYYGGNVGDKSSGMNVKYASDPYWGEKAAQNYYYFDKQYGLQDYGKYGIGIKTSTSSFPVKAEANNNSATLYFTGPSNNYSVLILKSVTGEAMNGSNIWYQIQTDPTLNASRTGIVQDQGTYNYNHNIGYIHSSYLGYVRAGKEEKKRYTINFDPNGGLFNDNITSTKSLTVEELVIPEVNSPSKAGYTFVGWDKDVVGATEDVTYYAVYRSDFNYDITFDAAGGIFSDGESSKVISVAASEKPVFEMKPTKEGYIFLGWDKELEIATSNTTYKALYKEQKTYQITFDASDGAFMDGTTSKTISVAEGEMPNFNLEPNKEEHVFVKWDEEIAVASENKTYKAVYENILETDNVQVGDGFFYLDNISNNDGKLQIKGFQTIEGINNDLNTNIQYMIMFVNLNNTEEIYVDTVRRVTDPSEIPYPSYGMGNHDYSYAWFSYETDFEGLPEGNYMAVIGAYSNHEVSFSVLNNRMFVPQVTSYSGAKEVIIKNDYYLDQQPVEFVVRDSKLADRTTKTYTYNQFDQFFELHFTNQGLLHISGYTYSYGMDLAPTAKVSRSIIFENQENYNKSSFKLNAIQGDYEPALPQNDFLPKSLAWYSNDLDLSTLEKGTYQIYIATSTNISDVSTLTDLFNQDLSKVTKTLNGKTYQFKLSREHGNALELIVS